MKMKAEESNCVNVPMQGKVRKNDFTRHQEIFCKLAPYCLKAPGVGEGSVGVCWHLSVLGQNSIENSPPLVTLLQNVLYMHCPFDFLSCIQNINAKHGVGREILLSTAWSETLTSFLLHWPDRVQQGFLLFLLSPVQIEASSSLQWLSTFWHRPWKCFYPVQFLTEKFFSRNSKREWGIVKS